MKRCLDSKGTLVFLFENLLQFQFCYARSVMHKVEFIQRCLSEICALRCSLLLHKMRTVSLSFLSVSFLCRLSSGEHIESITWNCVLCTNVLRNSTAILT